MKQNEQEVQLQAKTKFETKKEYLIIQKVERNTTEILNTREAEDKIEYSEDNCVVGDCSAVLFPSIEEMKEKYKKYNWPHVRSLHLVMKWQNFTFWCESWLDSHYK